MSKIIKRVFVSVPFKGRSESEIFGDMENAMTEYIEKQRSDENADDWDQIDFIHNYYVEKSVERNARVSKHPQLVYLAAAIRAMASCDDVIFGGEWQNANGCAVEHEIYKRYFKGSGS